MFDMVDYKKRQRSIRRITIAALVISLLSFFTVGLSLFDDQNTQSVIEFLWLCSTMTVVAGLFASFVAWYEKKIEQFKQRVFNKD